MRREIKAVMAVEDLDPEKSDRSLLEKGSAFSES
jgi:hypothetical protein